MHKTDDQQADKLNPPLKWAGGKRWLVPRLRKLYAPHRDRRLVEPFCGGLAIALGLRPAHSLLNDINPHLINFYRQLQRGLTATIEMRNDEALYYAHRERFNRLIREEDAESREAAELFYFLNRTGYNGLCRFNRKGFYNVPMGRHKTINYCRDFTAYQAAFARWTFTARDFDTLALTSDDFVYADPPYDVEFTTYSRGGFDWADQVRLAEWLAQYPGPVVLSNHATDRVIALYESHGFGLEYLEGPRRISRTGDRSPAREVLATKGL